MTSPRLAILLLPGLIAACTAPRPTRPAAMPTIVPAPSPASPGLDRVMGQDPAALTALLGPPALDAREGPARRLQFRGPACVLDTYLYPDANRPGAPRVTWIDARTLVGGAFDRASCIAALARH